MWYKTIDTFVRCDRNVPCEHCARSKGELCTYLLDDPTGGMGNPRCSDPNHTTKSPAMPAIPSLHPSPDYAMNLNPPDTGASAAARDTQLSYFSLPTPRTDYSRGGQGRRKEGGADSEVPQSAVAAQALIDRVRHLEQTLLSTVTSREYLETASSPSSPGCEEDISIRGTFSKTRFFGQSHWMNSINQVRVSLFPVPCLISCFIHAAQRFAYCRV
jgi:hypothetical protein